MAGRLQFHHARLAEHITPGNPAYMALQHQMSSLLMHSVSSPAATGQQTNRIVHVILNRQAQIMAYNDTSLIFGLLFLIVMPLLLLMPSRRKLVHDS